MYRTVSDNGFVRKHNVSSSGKQWRIERSLGETSTMQTHCLNAPSFQHDPVDHLVFTIVGVFQQILKFCMAFSAVCHTVAYRPAWVLRNVFQLLFGLSKSWC